MSDIQQPSQATAHPDNAEMMSALFAQLVMQQANMAMLLLGKVPHPETGKVATDLDAARFFIDELEMLEVKTKGNLTKDESALLKQSLMSLRLAFVEAVESPAAPAPTAAAAPTQPGTDAAAPAPEPSPAPVSEEEHRKKFSKKY